MNKNKYKPSLTNENRQIPFWSLNDLLTESEIRRQINEFNKAGFGGYFLHSRIGLVTPYMGEEWMKMIAAGIDEGEKLGMEPWLYDEDKWPSGYAGGVVPEKRFENRLKYIMCIPENLADVKIEPSPIGNYYPFKSIEDVKEQLKDSKFIKKIKYDDEEYSLYLWHLPWGDIPLNGTCYIDLMNSQTVDDFIESTYEKYKDQFGGKFGKSVPGIFTDEPSVTYPWPNIPFKYINWTQDFEKIFEGKYSYKITDHFDELFFDIGEYQKIRYDFYKALSDLFVESYAKKIYDWCEKNNLIFTGHYLGEESLLSNFTFNFSILRVYEYETYPGLDALGEGITLLTNYLMMKQVSSIAEQLGKKRVLSETYGGAGWNMSMEQQKAMAEIQLILGVNYFTPHLAHYSLRGERKRDYPASIFYQQPYWDDYKILNDYLNHLVSILTQGKREVNILFVHPIESVWIEYSPFNKQKVNDRNTLFYSFSVELLKLQKDFHYTDEDILARHGKIKDGKIVIGQFTYDFVILLEPLTIRQSTSDILQKTEENSCPVYFINKYPEFTDGKKNNNDYSRHSLISEKDFLSNVDNYLPQRYLIHGDRKNIMLHSRNIDGDEVIYLMNVDKYEAAAIELEVKGNTNGFDEIELVTGNFKEIPNVYSENGVKIPFNLEPQTSIIIKSREDKKIVKADKNSSLDAIIDLQDNWKIKESSLNSMPLDNCKICIDGEKETFSCNIIYAKSLLGKYPGKKTEVTFNFVINELDKIKNEIYLAAEEIPSQTIIINGEIYKKESDGWWTDISFHKYPVKDLLHNGFNEITIRVSADSKNEYEAIYLIGDFTVRSNDGITYNVFPLNDDLVSGDLTTHGYPFMSGRIKISKNIEINTNLYKRAVIKFESPNAIVNNFSINGSHAGSIIWKPYTLDITDKLKDGTNEITCELVSSLRNLLGPLHNTNYSPFLVGPEQFDNKDSWSDKYTLINFGLPDKLRLELFK